MSTAGAGLRTRARWRVALALAAACVLCLALSGAIGALQDGLLTMLPALALAGLMLTRPYLGEHTLVRLRAARTRRAPRPVSARARRLAPRGAVCGGRLLAHALAGRAPPLALAGCR